eukprot:11488205-Heterocapsa_arctica.AAC.1
MTYGQQLDARKAHTAYAVMENDGPCNVQQCPNCHIYMPAGYTVCVRCHCPFILVAIIGNEARSCKGPSAAPAVVMPKGRNEPADPSADKPARIFTTAQLAGSDLRGKAARSPVSEINVTLKRVMVYRWKWDNKKT